MPTEEFLTKLVAAKSRQAAASSRPLEQVPEGTSKQAGSLVKINAEGVAKDRKRHCRDGEGDVVAPLIPGSDISVPRPSEDLASGSLLDSKKRLRLFISDIGRVMASYEESEECHRRELAEAKEGRAEAEKRVSEVLEKERGATEKVSELLAQSVKWNTERDMFTASVEHQKLKINWLEASMRKFIEIYDVDVEKLTQEKNALSTELERLKGKLTLTRAKVSTSFEKGYTTCWNRLAAADFDVSEHTFEKYCEGLADAESSSSNGPAK